MRNNKSLGRNTSYKKFYLFLAVTLILISCKKEEEFSAPDIIGNWTVISFDDNVANTKVTKIEANTWSQFNNGDISVVFASTDVLSGGISGRNVTNSFNGIFSINNDSTIKIEDVIWTMIGEPLWGQLFHSIESAESFELNNNELKIFYNNKKNSITLIRTS